jgi:hypothetical protein
VGCGALRFQAEKIVIGGCCPPPPPSFAPKKSSHAEVKPQTQSSHVLAVVRSARPPQKNKATPAHRLACGWSRHGTARERDEGLSLRNRGDCAGGLLQLAHGFACGSLG